MFQEKASKERLDVVKSLMAYKPKLRASICAFGLEMKGYFDRLESLNMVFDAELSINIILSGLPADYNQFVLSYQMNRKETSIMELYSLLQIGKAAKGKSDRGSKRKAESEIAPTIDPKEVVCFYCNTKGHWKRSCLKYLKDLKDGKVKKGSHSGSCERGEGLMDLVPTDVCGPFWFATKDGKRYYVTFNDDFSRYRYVYLIKHKSDTFEVFKRYQNEVENQLGRKIKLTPPRTPQLNRVAERRNRTLLDMSADEEPIVNTNTQQEVVTPVKPDYISLPIRGTSGRVSKPPQFYYGFHIEEDKIRDSTLSELNKPANYKELMASPEAAKWKEGMKSEIQSMYDNQVCNLVDTTPGLKIVGLAKINSIRIMLAIVAFHDYEIWQMDVKTDFIKGKLIEDMFMAQPEGFENAKYPKRVCKLQKAIYGLKQASRC
ncbi:retrotransposon protein, putative, ty1-copia subclass [Tanacetum coccineum]